MAEVITILRAQYEADIAEAREAGYSAGYADARDLWTIRGREAGAAEVRARVEAVCDEAEKNADTYKRACIVTTGQVRKALNGGE